MTNLKKLLEKEVRFYKSPWEMDITNKELLKSVIPLLDTIWDTWGYDENPREFIDFLKTLTK